MMPGREVARQTDGADSLDDARDRAHRLVGGLAARQLRSHAAVAAVIAQARADEVPQPREAEEGGALPTQGRAQAGQLRQGARQERRLGVEAEAETVAEPEGE